jgi:hypothetical protein
LATTDNIVKLRRSSPAFLLARVSHCSRRGPNWRLISNEPNCGWFPKFLLTADVPALGKIVSFTSRRSCLITHIPFSNFCSRFFTAPLKLYLSQPPQSQSGSVTHRFLLSQRLQSQSGFVTHRCLLCVLPMFLGQEVEAAR